MLWKYCKCSTYLSQNTNIYFLKTKYKYLKLYTYSKMKMCMRVFFFFFPIVKWMKMGERRKKSEWNVLNFSIFRNSFLYFLLFIAQSLFFLLPKCLPTIVNFFFPFWRPVDNHHQWFQCAYNTILSTTKNALIWYRRPEVLVN